MSSRCGLNVIQDALDKVLFSDKFPPKLLPKSDNNINIIEKELWENRYDMNFCIEHLEVEVRLGRLVGRRFESSVPQSIYSKLCNGLQSYNKWDKMEFSRTTIMNFEKIDSSIRCVEEHKDGETTIKYVSKQKVCTIDFSSVSAFCDVRLGISLEIPVKIQPRVEEATRRVIRDRSSFTLGKWRYDLTTVTDKNGEKDYQIEIELLDPTNEQLINNNSQQITEDLRRTLLDLFRVVDPSLTSLPLEMKRQNWF